MAKAFVESTNEFSALIFPFREPVKGERIEDPKSRLENSLTDVVDYRCAAYRYIEFLIEFKRTLKKNNEEINFLPCVLQAQLVEFDQIVSLKFQRDPPYKSIIKKSIDDKMDFKFGIQV